MRLNFRHGNLFYVFLCSIMLLGPPILLAGGSAIAQSAWIGLTFGRDTSTYLEAVDKWRGGEAFQLIQPTFTLNTTVPGQEHRNHPFLRGEDPSNARVQSTAAVPSKIASSQSYQPLRYVLDPPVRYTDLKWRHSFELHSSGRHRHFAQLGFTLYAAASGEGGAPGSHGTQQPGTATTLFGQSGTSEGQHWRQPPQPNLQPSQAQHLSNGGLDPCVDAVGTCLGWAQAGECTSNPVYMQSECCCACNTCS
eukprot:COSAG05_NODE_2191_length_3420_cov_2.271906_4_plen_249_part_01